MKVTDKAPHDGEAPEDDDVFINAGTFVRRDEDGYGVLTDRLEGEEHVLYNAPEPYPSTPPDN